MKKFLLATALCLASTLSINAQMSDQQIIALIGREAQAGTSQSQIVTKLMQRGVKIDQIRRLRNQYDSQIKSRGMSGADADYTDDYVLPPWMLFKEGSATDAAEKILHYAENWNEPQFLDLRERLFLDRTDEDFKRNVSRIFDKLFDGGTQK